MLQEKNPFLTNLHKILDLVLVAISFVAAYYIKWFLPFEELRGLSITPNYYIILLLTLIASFIVFQLTGFYEPFRKQLFKTIVKRVFLGVFCVIISITFILYILHQADLSRMFVGIFAFLLVVLLLSSKASIYYTIRSYRTKDFNMMNILIIGSRERALDVLKAIINSPGEGFKVLGCLEILSQQHKVGKEVYKGVKIIGTLKHFSSLLVDKAVDEIIFAMPLNEIDSVDDYIYFAEELGVNVRIMPDFQIQKIMYRPATAKIYLDQFAGLPTISLSSTPTKTTELILKSFIDYIGATLGLLVLSPVFLLIAIAIKINSKGPVFFLQERCGLYGRTFHLIKFRTMVENAETLREQLLAKNEMDGPVFKIKNDPRVTAVGRFLRRTSLDEFPQLINVLRGEMSLVGPRPALVKEAEKYRPWQRRRLSMKPGLTCIWQISGRNTITFEDWMHLDLKYIDNWSLMLDLKIILMTLR
ncbi:MAG: sugar transferase, partial [Desulfobulbaceae bacterium]|nr:sugar transferase [Desulfobulbaceae bacterium]